MAADDRTFLMTVEEWNEHMAAIRRAAFSNLARQLLALCDDSTPPAIWDLVTYWQLEALR